MSAPTQHFADLSASEHDLGPLDQVPFGEGRAFAVGGTQVAVFRLRDGRVRALSAACSHRGGPIADGQTDDEVVLCPLHLHAFSLDTGCSRTGAEPLHSYPVTIRAGRCVITIDPST